MEGQAKESKAPLELSDAAAGCIAAILLFFVQKLPPGSELKALFMYLSPVAAILLNNLFSIVVRHIQFHYRNKALKSRYDALSAQRNQYVKVDHADPEVMSEYNQALKDTQIAMIHNTPIDLKKHGTSNSQFNN